MYLRNTIRSASALVLTMGLMVFIGLMLTVTSDQLRSTYAIMKIDFAEQQAAAAAEAITSFRETYLVELAATNDLEALTVNPVTETLDDAFEGVEWFGDCLVRWRVEPVRVTDANGRYITNPFLFGVKASLLADPDFVENHEYYHFRILSEAHYLRDPNLVKDQTISQLEAAGELPWQNPFNAICSVRASRVVQMSLNSLFKYALFYAKEGPYGDIEMGPGGWMGIAGRVHSNGSIYMSSGKATSWGGGGGMDIGSATDLVDCAAIGGVYRMRKDTLLDHRRRGVGATDTFIVDEADPTWGDKVYYGDGNQDPLPIEPGYEIPQNASIEDKTATKYKLNGKPVERDADSRNGEAMRTTHGAYLRDAKNSGATIVKTLSNIPQLGGRPFEHQRLFAEGTPIWTTNPSDPYDKTSWTILPNSTYLPATYYTDPDGVGGTPDFSFLTEPGVNSVPVINYAKKLYYVEDPRGFKAYSLGNSYTGLPGSLTIRIAVDEDNDGFLDGDGAGLSVLDVKEWYVDAGGLRQYYQRSSPGVGIHVIDGSNVSEQAVNLVDIFDTYNLYTYNPNPFGDDLPGDKPDYYGPGDAGFRYNGNYDNVDPANGDANGDSFGDNEVLGTYIDWAMNGKDDADNAGLFGLVIRERKYQKIPVNGSAGDWAGKPDRPIVGGGGGGGIIPGPTFQAELGTLNSASIDTNNAGYNGSGFVNVGKNGSTVSWTVDITTAGNTNVVFRYANGSGNRNVAIDLNGVQIDGSWTMTSTGSWTTYSTITKTINFPLGTNTLTIRTIGNDGGNIDEVTIPTAGAGPGAGGFASADYVNYLKSQYVVYFGTTDVTDLFFDYDAAAATNEEELVVFESEFLDRREGAFMQYQFWDQDTASFPKTGSDFWFETNEYRVNMLTFNMRKTLDFLMNTDHGTATTGVASGTMLNEMFNGMIYAHRTRRSDDYTPWETPLWHPTCHLHWKRTPIANYEFPQPGHRPWVDLPSALWSSGNPAGFDWRTGSGPAMTYQSAIRLANAEDLDYGIYYHADMSTPDPSDDYYTKKGLTFVTPNTCYIEGDFNTVQYGDSDSGALGTRVPRGHANWGTQEYYKHVPAAVFADFVNLLSNDWDDASQSYGSRPNVSSDCYMIVSIIMNNVPSHMDGDGYSHYSGGAHNILRYLESWSGDTHHIKGSLVVMNIRRYSFSHIGNNGGEPPNKGNSVYSPPNRDFEMNSDLFEKPGQPPFTPYGVTVTRTVSTVDVMSSN